MIVRCPRCGKETPYAENPFRPFCSERCKLIDLGNWASGAYNISTNVKEEEKEALPEAGKEKTSS